MLILTLTPAGERGGADAAIEGILNAVVGQDDPKVENIVTVLDPEQGEISNILWTSCGFVIIHVGSEKG
jgi:ABC-type cobalt transport system substrate-binding protein